MTPPKQIQLSENELQIWYTDLDSHIEQIDLLECFLSGSEKQRAGKYVFARDKNRFIISRAILRLLLGRYLNADPKAMEFIYSSYGKPGIEGSQVRFNLSHSGGKAVYAFALNSDIGIDIEKMRSDFDEMDLAGKYFSSDEIESLKLLPANLRKKGFFHCWTRKEAFIKAKGEGLSMKLDSFTVPVLPFYSEEYLPVRSDSLKEESWKIKILKVTEDFSAAAAIMKDYSEVRYWRLLPEGWDHLLVRERN